MKRGIFFLLIFTLLISFVSAQVCDYDPVCSPNTQSCGCGGTQTRYTLCDGGCSDWYSCSVEDSETICDDSEDNDCDNLVDCEDPDCSQQQYCIDNDGDSYSQDIDCDDFNFNIYPGASEICNNLDDNCNNEVDEGISRQCGQSNIGECTIGSESCISGVWVGCSATLPKVEICNNLDDNCDGVVDENCDSTQPESQPINSDPEENLETPEDTINNNPEPEPQLINSDPNSNVESSSEIPVRACIDSDGDGFGINCPKGFDCDDSDVSINPSAKEICNGLDDDCNAIIDDQLSRSCGFSNAGICSLGQERCSGGQWVGCTASLPTAEVCNGLDDDCDGETDEVCDADFSKKELALKQFLDLKFGDDDYDLDYYLDNYKKTRNYISIRKSSEILDEHTKITMNIIPIQGMNNLTVFEYIPKFVAHSASEIKFSIEPEIIQDDPLVAWHFTTLDEPVEITYEVVGEIEDAHKETSTIAFSESTNNLERPWFFNLLPLLFIPLLGFVFIFLVEIAHKKRK